jgi:hypothetical protein
MIFAARPLAVATLALMAAAGPALAQEESTNRVATETDWSVFVETDPNQCWVVAAPKSVRNTRDGREVDARRGDIRMYVSFWPADGKMGEVSVTGGYPYRDGSLVRVRIGGGDYELFTEGELAWSASPSQDQQMIAAMKRGTDAVVTGMSGRGTTTIDTFSLLGFTAAVEDAERRCAN